MSDNEFSFASVADTLTGAVQVLDQATDLDARQAEIDERMRPFTAEDGPWRHVTGEPRAAAERAIVDEQNDRAARALWGLENGVREAEAPLAEAIERTMAAPGPLEAWAKWTGTAGATRGEQINLWVLDELRQQRLDREAATLTPQQALAIYAAALADPHEPGNATTIRVFEGRYRGGWTGAPATSDDDIRAAGELATAIESARQARIPAEAVAAMEAVSKASARAAWIRQVHNLRPKHPERG